MFHALEKRVEDMRPTSEVFKSASSGTTEAFRSRFASSGKFEKAELESGTELASAAEEQVDAPDVDDNRSLYERLKEQRDAKQEEWEHAHAFKNQVLLHLIDHDCPTVSQQLVTHADGSLEVGCRRRCLRRCTSRARQAASGGSCPSSRGEFTVLPTGARITGEELGRQATSSFYNTLARYREAQAAAGSASKLRQSAESRTKE